MAGNSINTQYSLGREIILTISLWLVMALTYSAVASAEWDLEPALDIGNRSAEFDWSIAGNINGANPNIISELTWRNLKIRELNASIFAQWDDKLVLRGYWNKGDITAGDNQDSDYAYDNRQGEFSRSNNQSNSGSTQDNGVGIGMPIHFTLSETVGLTMVPMFGFSYHEQNLRMTNGVQTVSNTSLAVSEGFIDPGSSLPPVGYQLSNLNSTYETEWDDTWLGAKFIWELAHQNRLSINVEHHIADYYAHANWNLRGDLTHPVSFEHWANGTGSVISLGWDKLVYKQMFLGVNFDWQKWTTDSGVARFYDVTLVSGSVTALDTQFNGAEWRSSVIYFHLGFLFKSI